MSPQGMDASNSVPPGEANYMCYSHGARRLADSMKKKLSTLAPDTLNYGTVFIYKVPEKHRNKNPLAYTPRLVSIGPLHHGQSQLQAMEEYKLKYLNNFLHTFRVPLELLAEYVHSQEKLVRGCYGDTFIRNLDALDYESRQNALDYESRQNALDYESRQMLRFTEVILLDGVFIVELFLKNHFLEMREMGDIVFDNPLVSNDIVHDLLLFENQLPMRFVSTLYNAFVSGSVRNFLDDDAIDAPSFNDLVLKYFKNVGKTENLEQSPDLRSARHLVEFLAILHMPIKVRTQVTRLASVGGQEPINPRYGQKPPRKLELANCATATELRDSGVKFLQEKEKCLFEVHFDEKTGELKIPQLTVNDSTETFFRNLIAFEQSGYHPKYITSYVILLDALIDTDKDVDLLVDCKIIDNQLGTSEQVAELFNNLYKEFVTDPKEFYFSQLYSELNKYSRDIWHKWKSKCARWLAMLGRDYFGSPWSIISVIAAFSLLVLTIIQTVCSVLQV